MASAFSRFEQGIFPAKQLENPVRLIFAIEGAQAEQIREKAAAAGVSLSAIMRQALNEFLLSDSTPVNGPLT